VKKLVAINKHTWYYAPYCVK